MESRREKVVAFVALHSMLSVKRFLNLNNTMIRPKHLFAIPVVLSCCACLRFEASRGRRQPRYSPVSILTLLPSRNFTPKHPFRLITEERHGPGSHSGNEFGSAEFLESSHRFVKGTA